MMSRITLTLKRRFSKDDEMPYEKSPISTLDWNAVTRPPRVMQGRGRIQFVERAQGNTSMLVVSHVAGEEDAIASVAILEQGRDSESSESSESVEMAEMVQQKKGNLNPPV